MDESVNQRASSVGADLPAIPIAEKAALTMAETHSRSFPVFINILLRPSYGRERDEETREQIRQEPGLPPGPLRFGGTGEPKTSSIRGWGGDDGEAPEGGFFKKRALPKKDSGTHPRTRPPESA